MTDAENTAPPVRPGDLIAGKYRLGPMLGRGGMGAVFECEHVFLNQRMALKVLTGPAEAQGSVRFLNEARAAARIASEHVVRVTDFGILDGGMPYLVMELLQGSDLAGVLHTRGPLPISEAVDHILEALEALAQAHALGIVHRDLKP